ncbi:hypothetical protein ACXYMP_14780 [Aliiroseovarius sp. CAU 1755]
MNVNQIINMIIRRVTRQLVNKGVDAGIDMAARRGKSDDEMSPEDKARARQSKDLAKRARKAQKVSRKLF